MVFKSILFTKLCLNVLIDIGFWSNVTNNLLMYFEKLLALVYGSPVFSITTKYSRGLLLKLLLITETSSVGSSLSYFWILLLFFLNSVKTNFIPHGTMTRRLGSSLMSLSFISFALTILTLLKSALNGGIIVYKHITK